MNFKIWKDMSINSQIGQSLEGLFLKKLSHWFATFIKINFIYKNKVTYNFILTQVLTAVEFLHKKMQVFNWKTNIQTHVYSLKILSTSANTERLCINLH